MWFTKAGEERYGANSAEIDFCGSGSCLVKGEGSEVDLEIAGEPSSPEEHELAIKCARNDPVSSVGDAFQIYWREGRA